MRGVIYYTINEMFVIEKNILVTTVFPEADHMNMKNLHFVKKISFGNGDFALATCYLQPRFDWECESKTNCPSRSKNRP